MTRSQRPNPADVSGTTNRGRPDSDEIRGTWGGALDLASGGQ